MWQRKKAPAPARWPYRLPAEAGPAEVEHIRRRVEELTAAAQYGWVHTIDFGPFTKEGVMRDDFLLIAGHWDEWGWWPPSLAGLRVADIGCATGGLSLLAAHRGAQEVLAVDQIAEHLDQCAFLAHTFGVHTVRTLAASLYDLPGRVESGGFNLIILSGVLYHLSDMLVALYIMRELLQTGGVLLIESAAVDDHRRSYANFGRFAMGMWWQPTTLCIKDMCEFMGLDRVQVRMFRPDRCLARAEKTGSGPILFRRGLNYPFDDLRDAAPRSMDTSRMAPR